VTAFLISTVVLVSRHELDLCFYSSKCGLLRTRILLEEIYFISGSVLEKHG
jgi:hypothetical protein